MNTDAVLCMCMKKPIPPVLNLGNVASKLIFKIIYFVIRPERKRLKMLPDSVVVCFIWS